MRDTPSEVWLPVVALAIEQATRRLCGDRTVVQTDEVLEGAHAASRHTRTRRTSVAGLAERFRLSVREELAFWVLVAHQIDGRIGTQLESLGAGDVTLGAIADVVYGGVTSEAVTELGPRGKLASGSIVEIHAREATTWVGRSVRVDERMLRLALEASLPDHDACMADLSDGDISLQPVDGPRIPVETLAVDPAATRCARDAFMVSRAVILVSGKLGTGRRSLLAAIAAERAEPIIIVNCRYLARDPTLFMQQAGMIVRECKLTGRLPLLTNVDALVDERDDRLSVLGSELEALDGPVLATCGCRHPAIRWKRPTLMVELGPVPGEKHAALWVRALGADRSIDGELLSARYPLAPAMVVEVGQTARARASQRELEEDDVLAGIRALSEDRLHTYAHRVRITQTWDAVVLPHDQQNAVAELRARIRDRRRVYETWGFGARVGKGLGVCALFSGPPGTGKTMVAAVLAQELGLELYQVDLGQVTSKWLGETERNLGAMFDAAEATNAMLLFDEADALFGKRTEVRSSNDRYANLETNYLLQRLESFTGVCVLTTNHESNIDPAFMRRLSMRLHFELPDVAERAQLWSALLPPEAPAASGIDFAALARRYEMSGGYIRNAVVRAAFLASDAGTQITTSLLDYAARLEYDAMGKIA